MRGSIYYTKTTQKRIEQNKGKRDMLTFEQTALFAGTLNLSTGSTG